MGTPESVLREAAAEHADVLALAEATVFNPDYWGGSWHEVYRGNPLLERFVMVDAVGNVVHVRRRTTTFATEHLTITYLPSWFYLALRVGYAEPLQTDEGQLLQLHREQPLTQVTDRGLAIPLVIDVEVKEALPAAYPVGDNQAEVDLPRVVYDVQPARGAAVLAAGATPADGASDADAIERVHWTSPSIRITAAPGVAVIPRALYPSVTGILSGAPVPAWSEADDVPWGEVVIAAALEIDNRAGAARNTALTSDQALGLQIERRQNAESLPGLGAWRRETGVAEVDLSLADSSPSWGVHFDEITRPDGVDLDFFDQVAWARLQRAQADPTAGLVQDLALLANAPFQLALGTLAPGTPVPVRIRVDPQSEHDRFAYSVTYLRDRVPVASAFGAGADGPFFRLTVIRTPSVTVRVDALLTDAGADELRGIVDYREQVVRAIEDVPAAIVDHGDAIGEASLEPRELTPGELFDLTVTAVGLLPWPPFQVAADAYDYATLLSYLVAGTDPLGREMSRVEFALTLGGILLPEALEPLLGRLEPLFTRLIAAGDGMLTVGDDAILRMVAALGVVTAKDLKATVGPMMNAAAAP